MSQLYNKLNEILVFITNLLQNISRAIQKKRETYSDILIFFLFVVVVVKPNKTLFITFIR